MQVKLSLGWLVTWHQFYDEPPVSSEGVHVSEDLFQAEAEFLESAKVTKLVLDIGWLRTCYQVTVIADDDWSRPRHKADCETRFEARDVAERWSAEVMKR